MLFYGEIMICINPKCVYNDKNINGANFCSRVNCIYDSKRVIATKIVSLMKNPTEENEKLIELLKVRYERLENANN